MSSPPLVWTSPAIIRSSDDFPAPLGPTRVRARPADSANDSPEKTCRPPRTQVRSEPTSRIGSVERGGGSD